MDNFCDYCKVEKAKYRCSLCHFFGYCKATCDVGDWSTHKLKCLQIACPKSGAIAYPHLTVDRIFDTCGKI